MKWQTVNLAIVLSLGCWFSAKANVTGVIYTNDNDGVITCCLTGPPTGLGTPNVGLTIAGDHTCMDRGDMLGYLQTDSVNDPTLTLTTVVENDTGVDWTYYLVDVWLTAPFTISSPTIYTPPSPSGWTINYTPSSTLIGSLYYGYIDLYGGTPVSGNPADPGTLDFSYIMHFSGSMGYDFGQSMTPIPEPSTAGLLAVGGLLCGLFGRRLRR